MSRVLISLVGGRPLPNILVALHLKPDHLYLVVSQDSLGPHGNYEKAVNALPGHLRPAQPFAVRPYVLQETFDRCQSLAEQHIRDEIIFNSASEPKTMALGAYEIAKQLKAEGRHVDLCYLSRDGLVWVFNGQAESVKIGIRDYFASYGWRVNFKTDAASDKLKALASLLVENLSVSTRVLSVLRGHDDVRAGKQTVEYRQRLTDEEFAWLKQVEALQILSAVRREEGNACLTFNSVADGRLLLGGEWLEYHLYRTAAALTYESGKPLFDECGWGLQEAGGKGEIDFTGIFGGQVILTSCKTESTVKRHWFEEVHSKAEQLGKGMSSTLLVSTISRRHRTKNDLQNYARWARERHIVLVFAEEIPQLPAILRKIVAADPKAEPLEVPCYPRI